MRIVAIVQARLGSTRLPQKILADIEGQSMLARVVERARAIRGVDGVVLACPREDGETLLHHFKVVDAIPVCAPQVPADDVLARYDATAQRFDADVVMRLTSDCPLLDPVFSGEVLRRFLSTGSMTSFVSNVASNVDGFDTEVFSARLLRLAALEATSAEDREHVTPWMRRYFPWPQAILRDGPAIKLSVDTLDDLERVRAIYRHVGKDVFSRTETLDACAALGIGSLLSAGAVTVRTRDDSKV